LAVTIVATLVIAVDAWEFLLAGSAAAVGFAHH